MKLRLWLERLNKFNRFPISNGVNFRAFGLLLSSCVLLAISVLVPFLNFVIWFAFVPLLILISKYSLKQSLGIGLIGGVVFFTSLLYWVSQYEIRILLIVLGLSIPFMAVFAFLTRWFWNQYRNSMIRILAVPAAWFLVDFVYSLTPVNIIGDQIAFLQGPHFPGIIRITGLSGITFLILLCNSLIAHYLLRSNVIPAKAGIQYVDPRLSAQQNGGSAASYGGKHSGMTQIFLLIIIVTSLIYGNTSKFPFYQTQPLQVALVQHNFPIDFNWRSQNRDKIMNTYLQTVEQLGGSVDLIVFPQYGLPVDVLREPELFDGLAKQWGVSIVLGTYIPKVAGGSLESGARTDSALIFSPDLPVQEQRAVTAPPFRRIGQVLGETRRSLQIKKMRTGMMLCYENTQPEEGRWWALKKAQILISLSNPGHFMKTHLPLYHLTHDRIKAIETGKYVIRVSPNGFSALINPNGELIKVSQLNQEMILKGVVYPNDTQTGFVQWGLFVPNLSAMFGLILFILPYFRDSSR